MNMDAFLDVTGLIHSLQPAMQDAVDRILKNTSSNYWKSRVIDKLRSDDRKYWLQNDISCVRRLDLQGILKVVEINFDLFQNVCGKNFTNYDWRALKKVRNDYAHASGAVPTKNAIEHVKVLSKFALWLDLGQDCAIKINKLIDRLVNEGVGSKLSIRVSARRNVDNVQTGRDILSSNFSSRLEQIDGEEGAKVRKSLVGFGIKPEDFILTKCAPRLFALNVSSKHVAVLYNTPSDEYIAVELLNMAELEEWICSNTIVYDSTTGHMSISKIVKSEQKLIEDVWNNDATPNEEIPDHGGGALDYNQYKQISITISEMLKKRPERRSGFLVLNDELYQRMLSGTLENWQIYLHPEQRRAVEMDSDGPIMVKGAAGTGKTVVLVHRAKWLLENKFTHNERILITTFNKSLEYNIRSMLKKICSSEEMSRLDVMYFDEWLKNAWKKIGGKKLLYNDVQVNSFENAFWAQICSMRLKGAISIDRDDDFISREFETVIQELAIDSVNSYYQAVRPKKYGVLRKEERDKLWDIFGPIIPMMLDNDARHGIATRMRAINHVARMAREKRFGIADQYAAVLVDESQDMGAAEYRLFGALTGNYRDDSTGEKSERANSLLFAGDGHQRIYSRVGSLSSCGINVKGGRTIILRKCYRSSKAIKRYAESILSGVENVDMDAGMESLEGSEAIAEGISPSEEFLVTKNYELFYDKLANTIKTWLKEGGVYSDFAVLCREGNFKNNKIWRLQKIVEGLVKRGVPAVAVHGRSEGSHDEDNAVKVMTMHRAKGMQFRGVILNLDGWPHKLEEGIDAEATKAKLDEEKQVLYMAIMRALKFVILTGMKGRPKELSFVNLKASTKVNQAIINAAKRESPTSEESKSNVAMGLAIAEMMKRKRFEH